MPYIFPKRKLRDSDILDVVELNEDFIPAAEVCAGNLNAHNIQENVTPDFRRNNTDETAYYKYAFNVVDGDPKLGSASSTSSASYTLPSLSSFTGEHQVRNDNSWDVVDSSSLRISAFSTGVSTLWITAYAQYFWMGFVAQSAVRGAGGGVPQGAERTHHMWASEGNGNCRLQFAIRVNGRIIESTITGKQYAFENSVEPIRSKYQRGGGIGFGSNRRKGDYKFPGPHGTWTEGATALGPVAIPVRLGCHHPVQPGKHIIDLVVRRLPRIDGDDDKQDLEDTNVDDDIVLVGSRKLFVVELKRHPTATSTLTSTSVPAFETEDTITSAELQTSRTDTIRTALNTVKRGALARGALNHYHLKSPVIAANQITRNDSTASFTARYPGHGSWKSTVHTNKFTTSSSGIGFYNLETSSGKFQVGPATGTSFSLTEPSIFIVTGNVQLHGIKNDTAYGGFGSGTSATNVGIATMANFAAIALGITTASSSIEAMLASCISYVNSFNAITHNHNTSSDPPTNFNDHDKSFDEEVNVPIFHVFTSTELSSLSGGEDIATFNIYGSALSAADGGVVPVKVFYQRCNLSVIQLFI